MQNEDLELAPKVRATLDLLQVTDLVVSEGGPTTLSILARSLAAGLPHIIPVDQDLPVIFLCSLGVQCPQSFSISHM